MINKGQRDVVALMDSYFELEGKEFSNVKGEIFYLGEKLTIMEPRHISKVIEKFGETFARHYLEKQRLLGNVFTYEEIEPFVKYLDSYLIEESGGSRKVLNDLSSYLTGERFDYPTQRLIRLTILDRYFSPYLQG